MFGRPSGQHFCQKFLRKLQFFKVSRSYDCLSCADIFNGLDTRVINDGFKKTKIRKFQSEETLQIDISRDEQLMKVIERMEKFRCDDSDDE